MNDLIILSILLASPRHGYGLKQRAGQILGQEAMHNNLVYPLLRRFVAEGWVTQKSVPGERGQTRKLYAITDKGRRFLINRLSEYGEKEANSPDAFLLRVGLFPALPPEARERILGIREDVLNARDKRLTDMQQTMDLGIYGADVVRHLRKGIRHELDWIRHLRQLQKKQKGKLK